jgi:hypothetical protein
VKAVSRDMAVFAAEEKYSERHALSCRPQAGGIENGFNLIGQVNDMSVFRLRTQS